MWPQQSSIQQRFGMRRRDRACDHGSPAFDKRFGMRQRQCTIQLQASIWQRLGMIHETTVQHVTSQGVDVISKTAVKVSKHRTHQYQVCDHHISPTVLPSAQTCRVPETNNVNLNEYFWFKHILFQKEIRSGKAIGSGKYFSSYVSHIYLFLLASCTHF